jgi:hypothetical protein
VVFAPAEWTRSRTAAHAFCCMRDRGAIWTREFYKSYKPKTQGRELGDLWWIPLSRLPHLMPFVTMLVCTESRMSKRNHSPLQLFGVEKEKFGVVA